MASTKRSTLLFLFVFGMFYFNALAKSSCPNGFKYTADGIPKCYAVVTQRMTWDEAQTNCRDMQRKAHLVAINSGMENQVVQEILKDFDCPGTPADSNGLTLYKNDFWTGGRRATDSCYSSFYWKAGIGPAQTVHYTDWIVGQPTCYAATEFCIAIVKTSHSQWNPYPCKTKFCSVCEVVKIEH